MKGCAAMSEHSTKLVPQRVLMQGKAIKQSKVIMRVLYVPAGRNSHLTFMLTAWEGKPLRAVTRSNCASPGHRHVTRPVNNTARTPT
jgi:hypothetical protein